MRNFIGAGILLIFGATSYAATHNFADVGITTTSSNVPLLTASGWGGVVFSGTLNSGAIPASGSGTRLMWYPKKAAFRVGDAWGTVWDDANIGMHSVGLGSNSSATGFAAVAVSSSTASGDNSFSAGWGSLASGVCSVAMGIGTASGPYSFAAGWGTASGYQSSALGGGDAIGDHSNAIGWGTTATAAFSTVVGVWNELIGNPTADVPSNPLFVVGNGSSNSNRSNAFEVHRDGTILMAPQGDISMGEFGP